MIRGPTDEDVKNNIIAKKPGKKATISRVLPIK